MAAGTPTLTSETASGRTQKTGLSSTEGKISLLQSPSVFLPDSASGRLVT